jgi:hypothetical protein
LRRALFIVLSAFLLLAACGGDDGGSDDAAEDATSEDTSADDTGSDDTTTTSEATEGGDAEAVCAELEALSDIDPDGLPTQEDVDRVLAAADGAPPEIADALGAVAAVGQLIADEGPEALDEQALADLEAEAGSVVEASETLVTFTTEECGFDVPLFSSFG